MVLRGTERFREGVPVQSGTMQNRWKNSESVLFLLLILIHLIPLWSFRYFPSQDGPAHLENAMILKEYHNPESTALREYYVLNPHPSPNWFGHLILAGLMSLFPILIAEKIFLSGYIILFPLAVRYALRSIRPDAGFLAVLSFPFIYSYPLHMGFYYFCYSLVIWIFLIGYWLRHRTRLTAARTLMLCLLWLLLYFTHLVSLVMAWLALLPLSLWLARAQAIQGPQGPSLRLYLRTLAGELIRPLAASLPALVLVLVFFQAAGVKTGYSRPAADVAGWLLKLGALVSYDNREVWLSTALAGFLLLTGAYALTRRRDCRPNAAGAAFFMVFGVYLVLFFLAPRQMSGGSIIIPRLALYPYLALILGLGTCAWRGVFRRGIVVVAVILSISMLGLHTARYGELNDYLEEYLSGMDRIEDNTTLAPLCFSQRGHSPDGRELSIRVKCFMHAAGYIAAEKHLVEFTNYEANTKFFPVAFRPDLNPYKTMGMLEHEPPRLHPARLRGTADYMLVWNVQPDQRESLSTQTLFCQLEAGYDLIFTSPQRGLMQLYRRKGAGSRGERS